MQRKTRQRDAIQATITRADRPLSPRAILDRARRAAPGLGLATVYRAINDLVTEGRIRPVAIPGGPPHYEAADLQHHHHFFCRDCGNIYEMQGCLLKTAGRIPKGFQLEGHEITLYGLCPSCA